jgi:glutaredoxin
MTEKVVIYTKVLDETGECPFCIKAKEFLSKKGIPYKEHSLSAAERQAIYDDLQLEGTHRTVPQILICDVEGEHHRVGGFSELVSSGIESLFRLN